MDCNSSVAARLRDSLLFTIPQKPSRSSNHTTDLSVSVSLPRSKRLPDNSVNNARTDRRLFAVRPRSRVPPRRRTSRCLAYKELFCLDSMWVDDGSEKISSFVVVYMGLMMEFCEKPDDSAYVITI